MELAVAPRIREAAAPLTSCFVITGQTFSTIAAAAGGQWDKAEEHYKTALRQAAELPIVIAQPEVRRWYAHTLIDRDGPGDRERARELLGDASPMYRKIGMPMHTELTLAMLRDA
jgi:hypothetical protein